jgi:hypothetical protein
MEDGRPDQDGHNAILDAIDKLAHAALIDEEIGTIRDRLEMIIALVRHGVISQKDTRAIGTSLFVSG